MKIHKIFIFGVLLGSLAGFTLPPAVLAGQTELLLGSGKTEITPQEKVPLAGFGKRRGKLSEGTHDPVYARALSLSRGRETFVFVSLDLVLVDEDLRQVVIKKIKNTSLPEDHLVIFATHNHSGPGAIGGRFWERFIMGKFRKSVFEPMTDQIARAVIESLKNQIPVTAEYGETNISDLIENRMDEKLIYPHLMRVMRFKNGGKIKGSLIFMAAHPTLLKSKNFMLSAEFPGALTHEIEKTSENSVALFVNGAAGDLRPHLENAPEDAFQKIEAYGRALAEKINNISFETMDMDGPWQARLEKVKLPKVKVRAGFFKVPSLMGNRFFPRTTYFQAFRLGSFLFLAFPGELASETGLEIEKQTGKGLTPLIIGYANDYLGYIVPERYYKNQDNYEATASFYGHHLDWFFESQALRFADGLMSAEEKAAFQKPGELFFHEGLPVLKLKGNAYHVGFEEGRLLKKEIQIAVHQIFDYLENQLPLPLVDRVIINELLDRGWNKMSPYISYEEDQQMRGLADGADVPLKKIQRLHALPEVYPAWCTNGAYWGKATQNGRLIAIRNLDWNREMGIHRIAAVKWIEMPGRIPYVNIGYYGFTGVLSGINGKGISVGQIGASSKDESMEGVPMPFLLKRILSESESLEDAAAIFKRSDRTRGYNYVIADALRQKAMVVETTQHHLAIFADNDPEEAKAAYSFCLSNAVFRGDPALDSTIRDLQWASKGNPNKPGAEQPGGSAYEIRYLKHGQLVQKYYGQIDSDIAKTIAQEVAPGSNIQSVIYAFPDFWVANAKDNLPAAKTPYAHFNLAVIASEAKQSQS